jgi:hypothetical protein
MKRSYIGIGSIAFLGAALSSQAALTAIVGPSSDGNPPGTLVQVMETLLNDSNYDATDPANRIQDTGVGVTDQVWTITTPAATAIVLEIAGNKGINNFGLYNLQTKQKLEVFAGGNDATTPSRTVSLTPAGIAQVSDINGPIGLPVTVGTQFGFYLESGTGGPTYYSRQSDNTGTDDQMVTLKTDVTKTLNLGAFTQNAGSTPWNPGEYLLAWEDLDVPSGDRDYQDLLVKVSAIPVPEPSTYIAGGLALLPLLFGLRSRLVKK